MKDPVSGCIEQKVGAKQFILKQEESFPFVKRQPRVPAADTACQRPPVLRQRYRIPSPRLHKRLKATRAAAAILCISLANSHASTETAAPPDDLRGREPEPGHGPAAGAPLGRPPGPPCGGTAPKARADPALNARLPGGPRSLRRSPAAPRGHARLAAPLGPPALLWDGARPAARLGSRGLQRHSLSPAASPGPRGSSCRRFSPARISGPLREGAAGGRAPCAPSYLLDGMLGNKTASLGQCPESHCWDMARRDAQHRRHLRNSGKSQRKQSHGRGLRGPCPALWAACRGVGSCRRYSYPLQAQTN